MTHGRTPTDLICTAMRTILEDPKSSAKEKLQAAATIIRITRRRSLKRKAEELSPTTPYGVQATRSLADLAATVEGRDLPMPDDKERRAQGEPPRTSEPSWSRTQ